MVNKIRSAKINFSKRPWKNGIVAKKAQTMKTVRLVRRASRLSRGTRAVFRWLKFHGLNFAPLVNDLSAQLMLRATLAAYYVSWVAGLSSDADDQEVIYVEPPERSRVIAMCAITGILIAIPFGILCYLKSYRAFAAVLSAFLIFNVICWLLAVAGFSLQQSQKPRRIIPLTGPTPSLSA